jgi:isochorismate synthase
MYDDTSPPRGGLFDGETSTGQHAGHSTSIDDCLRNYTSNGYLFASPCTTLVADGDALTLEAHLTVESLPVLAHDLLVQAQNQGLNQPVLMGMVPFDARRPSRLVVPEHYLRSGPLRNEAPIARQGVRSHALTQVPVPAPQDYEQAVSKALQHLDDASFELDKVVLARTLEITLAEPLDRPGLLRSLLDKNRHGYTYAVKLDTPMDDCGNSDAFIGATPELLVRREGSRVTVNPLAGTAVRHADPVRDEEIGKALQLSAKDLFEHAVVIDDVVRILRPFCSSLEVPPGPELTRTDSLWHLSTTIHGELLDPDTSSLELALAMHPTPAVCGYPRTTAFDLIQQLEPFDRQYFAGMVGWCDAQGNGEWAVALRCALCSEKTLTLYAGAGIVPGSEPAKELAETGNKFRTMLSAIGLDSAISDQ